MQLRHNATLMEVKSAAHCVPEKNDVLTWVTL